MKEHFPVTDPERIAFYRKHLSHPNAKIRAQAQLSIDPSLIDVEMLEILAIMLNDKSGAIADNAARLLAESELAVAADILFIALDDIEGGDAKMLATELSSMGALGYERLAKCAENSNPEVRRWVASTILRTHDPSALSIVKNLQNDEGVCDSGAKVSDAANRTLKNHDKLMARKD